MTKEVCEDNLQSMYIIPFDMNSAVQRNISTSFVDLAMQHVGCYNTTTEQCNQLSGNWNGANSSFPGKRAGCFDVMSQECSCTSDMCNITSCESIDGMMWWSDCLNCQCNAAAVVDEGGETTGGSETGTGAPNEGTNGGNDASDDTTPTPAASPGGSPIPSGGGFGCYGVGGTFGSCTCTAALCDQSSCAAAGVSKKTVRVRNLLFLDLSHSF